MFSSLSSVLSEPLAYPFETFCLITLLLLSSWKYIKSYAPNVFPKDKDQYRYSQPAWPSPPRVPFLGSLPFVRTLNVPQQLLSWRHRYGPIISVKLGTANESLVVAGHELAKELFINQNACFTGRMSPFFYSKELRVMEYFSPMMSTNSYVLYHRNLVLTSTKSSINTGFGNCIDRSTRYLLIHLNRQLPKDGQTGFDIKPLLFQSAAEFSVSVGFGISIEAMDKIPEGRGIFQATDDILGMMQFFDEPTVAFPFLVKLLWWRSQRLRLNASRVADKILDIHQKLYAAAKALYQAEGEDALENSVVKTLLTSGETGMSDFQHACLAGTTVAASMTTTPDTINSALACLAVWPKLQAELRAEIMLNVEPGKLPSSEASAVHQLPLLLAFIKEVMRMFPTFPIGMRVAEKDCSSPMLRGRNIHKGQLLYVNFYGINRDPEVYSSPDTFDPSRFLNSRPMEYWPKYGHVSFGAGRRNCPGSEFAMNALVTTLSRLIYCFEIKFPNSVTPSMDLLKPVLAGAEQHIHFPHLIFSPLQDLSQVDV